MSIKRLFENVELRLVLSDTRKVDLLIMSLQIIHFAAQWLKDLHIKQY